MFRSVRFFCLYCRNASLTWIKWSAFAAAELRCEVGAAPAPGRSSTLAVALNPGKHILIGNAARHFSADVLRGHKVVRRQLRQARVRL